MKFRIIYEPWQTVLPYSVQEQLFTGEWMHIRGTKDLDEAEHYVTLRRQGATVVKEYPDDDDYR